MEGTFKDKLSLLEVCLLGGDAEVISIDEAATLRGEWLVIGVNVEEERGQYTALW